MIRKIGVVEKWVVIYKDFECDSEGEIICVKSVFLMFYSSRWSIIFLVVCIFMLDLYVIFN